MGIYFYLGRRLGRFSRNSTSRFLTPARTTKTRVSAGKLVLSQKTLAVSLLIMLGLTSFAYLMLINQRMTKGFEIKDLEKRIVQLQKDQKELERSTTDLQSIQQIQKKLNLQDYISTTNVSYIKNQQFASR